MKRRIGALFLALSLLFLTACGGDPAQETESGDATPSPSGVIDETYNGPVNPLTGTPIDEQYVNRRPVAIMINNLKAALPQQGISQADIIYEVPAEGGITRMLAVYQNAADVGTIGSIRSSRPYYLELALGHDALYIHAGGSNDAYANIAAWKVDAFDGVRGPYMSREVGANLMWRDPERMKDKAYEHTVVTTGEAIEQYIPSSVRREHEAGYQYNQTFADDGTPAGGESANTLTLVYSTYKTGVFTYLEEGGAYLISEYGKPYVDGNTGDQVAVTNVLVLKTACNLTGDKLGHITVELKGGEGYYACGGKIIPIRWSKADRNSPIVYTTEDGQPLVLGRGKTYVNIVPLNAGITFE